MRVLLRDRGGERELDPEAFPLVLLPSGELRPLAEGPGAGGAPCFIGLSAGEPFVQPGPSGPGIRLNGRPVRESQWLQNGDRLRCADTAVRCHRPPGRLVFEVEAGRPEGDTLPPVEITPPRTPAEPTRIEAVAFQPAALQPRRPARRIHPGTVLLILVFGLLGTAAWYLLEARSVEILIEPPPDRLDIEGSLNLALAGRYLLRPGHYVVTADMAGYRPLRAPLEVGTAARQEYRFALEKLPGRLALSTPGVDGVEVVVDGQVVGTTPLPPIPLPAGPHRLHLSAARHLDHERSIEIEGMGITQALTVTLTPRWAEVSVNADPQGAILRVDGQEIGPVPRTVELLAGEHTLELRAPLRQTWTQHIQVTANQAMDIPTAHLAPASARVQIETHPSAANITVDGSYAGRSPLELPLKPGQAHRIQVSRAGYAPLTRDLTLQPGQVHPLELTLSARRGSIRFESSPPGAELWVDGRRHGTTPVTLDLLAVSHRIEFRRAGYAPYRTRVTPRPGFDEVVAAALQTPPQARAAAAPKTLKAPDGQVLRLIPGGEFTMGASRREQGRRSNETLRSVRLSRPFYLGIKEVTNEAFRRFRPGHDSGSFGGLSLNGKDRPVVNVSWEDAARYCNWLSAKAGLPPVYAQSGTQVEARRPLPDGYRLPTEAEWAWAARYPRGKDALRYPWGTGYPPRGKAGNYADASAAHLIPEALADYRDGFAVSAPVGRFGANALGLFDLGGNVAEWTHDHYAVYPGGGTQPVTDPLGPKAGRHHVIRGASWRMAGIGDLRLAHRGYGDSGRPDLGFRIARNGPSTAKTAMKAP